MNHVYVYPFLYFECIYEILYFYYPNWLYYLRRVLSKLRKEERKGQRLKTTTRCERYTMVNKLGNTFKTRPTTSPPTGVRLRRTRVHKSSMEEGTWQVSIRSGAQ